MYLFNVPELLVLIVSFDLAVESMDCACMLMACMFVFNDSHEEELVLYAHVRLFPLILTRKDCLYLINVDVRLKVISVTVYLR